MVKTPEEYFADQSFDVLPPQDGPTSLSAAERAFVQKYLGSDALADLPVLEPEQAMPGGISPALAAPDPDELHATGQAPFAKPDLRTRLAAESSVQLVSFFVRGQIFMLPVAVIVEVLRYMPLTRLPMAPPFVAGVVNLRGRVTPLLYLDALLTLEKNYRYTPQSSIIVCDTDNMHLGLIIDKVHTLYTVEQDRICWNAETQLGAGAEFLCGMADIANHLHGIVNPEMIVERLMES